MKKLILIIAVAFIAFAFTSCRKDWTCVCTEGGISDEIQMTNLTKAEAKLACNNFEFSPDENCELR